MIPNITRTLRPACVLLLAMSLVTGLAYPAAVTALAGVLFPHQAEGSLIVGKGGPAGPELAGSELLGQQFSAPGHFWGRPSATAPMPYNAAASGGSNLSPAGEALQKTVAERVAVLRTADPGNAAPVPQELVTASGSGLDPHISPAAALWQVPRVARARGLEEAALRQLVARRTEGRSLGFLGEERVNVLLLNRDLDSQAASAHNGQ